MCLPVCMPMCICIPMCLWTHTHYAIPYIDAFMHVCLFVYVRNCVCVCVYLYVPASVYIYPHVCICINKVHVNKCVHTLTCDMHVYVCIHTHSSRTEFQGFRGESGRCLRFQSGSFTLSAFSLPDSLAGCTDAAATEDWSLVLITGNEATTLLQSSTTRRRG